MKDSDELFQSNYVNCQHTTKIISFISCFFHTSVSWNLEKSRLWWSLLPLINVMLKSKSNIAVEVQNYVYLYPRAVFDLLTLTHMSSFSSDDSSWNRGGFLPNSDPVEALRGIPSGKALIRALRCKNTFECSKNVFKMLNCAPLNRYK